MLLSLFFSFICVFEGYIKDEKFLLLLTGLQLGNMLAKSAYPKEYNFLYYVHSDKCDKQTIERNNYLLKVF